MKFGRNNQNTLQCSLFIDQCIIFNVCRLRMPKIVSLGICFKKLHLVKIGVFA